MANIKIPRKTFEKEIGKLDEEMQNKIAMFGTTLEKFNEEEIELEIFPNRPDLLSYNGFKKSFLAFIGKKTGIKKYKIENPKKNYEVIIDSSTKKIRPFTACAIIKGLKINEEKLKEIIDLQEKLHNTVGRKRKKLAIGIYPLEKIKLPIKYTALEPDKIKFIPLESNRIMSGLEILQKHPTGKEYANLLKGKEKFPVFIDSNNQILSMPPVINSETVGKINQKTTDVFIECSGFDFTILKKCLNIIVTSLSDMGGKIYKMELKYPKKEITPELTIQKKKLNIENAQKLLGIKLNEKKVKTLLEKMGFSYSKGVAEIPAWRTDILHEVDLIEDLAIAYGYENFEPIIPKISTHAKEDRNEIIKRKIREILIGLNFLEVSNYHLTKKTDQFTNMGLQKKQEKDFVEIIESKTEYNILRKNLSHYLLKNFSENIDSEYPQKIFEVGKVFSEKNEIEENENLSLAITPGNFTQAKQVMDYLFKMLNLKIKIEEPQTPPIHFIKGRVGEIFIGEKSIGYLGEIHPKILKNWKIKMPVALLEIHLENIFEEF